MSLLNINDFIMYNKDNEYKSCGYKIDNLFLKNNISPSTDLFNNTAFPMGLLHNNYENKNYVEEDTDKIIEDSLFEKLIKLANENENNVQKKETKSKNKIKTNKTKTKKKN